MIRVQNLHKRYGKVQALAGLSFAVAKGSIFGFIGQNGAGKTTTLRILGTLLLPDSGRAEVAGHNVLDEPQAVRRALGYMPDFFGVYDDLTVSEYLEFYAGAYGIRGSAARRLRDELLQLVDLGDKADAYVEGLSRGMQQRLCLARALVHDPQVLLLDEPASGLDPLARIEMRELLKELGRMGKTIVISSHILSELADLCTHVGMVRAGRLVAQGPVAEMLQESRTGIFSLRVLREAERAEAVLAQLPGVSAVEVQGERVQLQYSGGAEGVADLVRAVVDAAIPVVHFAEVSTTLEDVFLRVSREKVDA